MSKKTPPKKDKKAAAKNKKTLATSDDAKSDTEPVDAKSDTEPPSKRLKAGSNSTGLQYELFAREMGLGYNDGPKDKVRVRVHKQGGKEVTRMLVCPIDQFEFIVCRNCGSVFRWHSAGKHKCNNPKPKSVTDLYDVDAAVCEQPDGEQSGL